MSNDIKILTDQIAQIQARQNYTDRILDYLIRALESSPLKYRDYIALARTMWQEKDKLSGG